MPSKTNPFLSLWSKGFMLECERHLNSSLRRRWFLEHHIALFPKKYWRVRLLVCLCTGYPQCWLETMMALSTSSFLSFRVMRGYQHENPSYPPKLQIWSSTWFWKIRKSCMDMRHRLTACIALTAIYTICAEHGILGTLSDFVFGPPPVEIRKLLGLMGFVQFFLVFGPPPARIKAAMEAEKIDASDVFSNAL